jgi:hypothetical protein
MEFRIDFQHNITGFSLDSLDSAATPPRPLEISSDSLRWAECFVGWERVGGIM